MSDWFSEGIESLKLDIAVNTGVDQESVDAVYSFLINIGMIDYDTEKEVVWNRYTGKGEEDDYEHDIEECEDDE